MPGGQPGAVSREKLDLDDIGDGLCRRAEGPGDEVFRRALHLAVLAPLFSGLDDALRGVILAQQFAAQNAGYAHTYPGARFDIVELDGRPIGRIVTARLATALVLVDIAIAEDARGRGAATRLIGAMIRDAAASDLPVLLRVSRGNAPARRLYERLGFTVVDADATVLAMEWRSASAEAQCPGATSAVADLRQAEEAEQRQTTKGREATPDIRLLL